MLAQNYSGNIWSAVILSLFTRRKDVKRGITKKDERESVRYSWVYSIGVCDSERVLRDERESGDKKDNRGESKVKALVRLSDGRKKLLFLVLHSIRN